MTKHLNSQDLALELLDAAETNDAGRMDALITLGADVNVAFTMAINADSTSGAAKLLGKGANPNYIYTPEFTGGIRGTPSFPPLSMPAARGNVALVDMLLNAGADPTQCDFRGNTAADMAFERHADIEKKLRAAEKTWLAAHPEAAAKKKAAELQTALEKTIIAAQGFYMTTKPEPDKVQKMTALLDQGANPNASFQNGLNAVTLATYYGDTRLLETLIGHGADLNKPDSKGTLPLTMAVQQGKLPIFTLLLDAGAKVDPATLKSLATQGRTVDMISILVKRGTNLSVKLDDGMTPLMLAIESSRPATVQALIEAGVDLTAKNDQGQTALDLAKANTRGIVVHGGILQEFQRFGIVDMLEKAASEQQKQTLEKRITAAEQALADLTEKFNGLTVKPAATAVVPATEQSDIHEGPDGYSGPERDTRPLKGWTDHGI